MNDPFDDMTPGADAYEMDEDDAAQDSAALEAAMAEITALKEQMLRVAADAENAKRRAEREANDARAFAIQKFARDLMGVADNLSRALQHAPRDDADPAVKNLVVGLDMTEKALLDAFERNGLKQLDPARGEKFDPSFHQAMMEQPAEDVAAGGVLQVMQTGYELMGRLIRPAMVVVAAKGSGAAVSAAASPDSASPTDAAGAYASPEGPSGEALDTKA
jgi:molecular chaperone GrpE